MTNYIAKLFQEKLMVAEVIAPTKEQAEKEIQHYALMYSQDGEVKIKRNYSLDEISVKKGEQR